MNISGIGVIQAQLLQDQTTQDPLQDVLQTALATNSSLYTFPTEKESYHLEIELKDGTKVTVDYVREGIQKKTSYEFGRFGDYSYGNALYSPENTANRILDFAKSLWDGSPEKLETLADAMEEGVSQARRTLGTVPGWLDNLISRTVDLLHEGIEDLKAEAAKAA